MAFHIALVSILYNCIGPLMPLDIKSTLASCLLSSPSQAAIYTTLQFIFHCYQQTDKARLQCAAMTRKTPTKHLVFLLLITDSRWNLDMASFQAQCFSSQNKAPGAPIKPCQSQPIHWSIIPVLGKKEGLSYAILSHPVIFASERPKHKSKLLETCEIVLCKSSSHKWLQLCIIQ